MRNYVITYHLMSAVVECPKITALYQNTTIDKAIENIKEYAILQGNESQENLWPVIDYIFAENV